jgi:hypothetical protein
MEETTRAEKIKEIKEIRMQWQERLEKGGQDPMYADGGGMNTLRGEILYNLKELRKDSIDEDELQDLSLFIPPEVPDAYMARARDIWYGVLKSYVAYKQDENYQYLCQIKDSLPKDIRKRSCIDNVTGYVQVAERALKEKNFVVARRHEHAGRYQDSFQECRDQIGTAMRKKESEREEPQAENTQMDLFHMGMYSNADKSR